MAILTEFDSDGPPSLIDARKVEEARAQANSQARAPDDKSARVPITIVTGEVFDHNT